MIDKLLALLNNTATHEKKNHVTFYSFAMQTQIIPLCYRTYGIFNMASEREKI